MKKQYKKRIDTINALINSSVISTTNTVNCNTIKQEYNNVYQCINIPQLSRRYVLMVFHSARAFDTTLKNFLDHYGLRTRRQHSIGSYLNILENHTDPSIGNLSNIENNTYKAGIANVRNRYLHEAGAYPAGNNEIFALLAEMDACLTRVFSL